MASFASVSDYAQAAFSGSVKPSRHGWPDFHHRSTMMGNPMPRRRTRTGKQAQPQICGARINYAKLKVDGGSQTSENAAEPNEALRGHRKSKANDTENQGNGLTGALAPQSAASRRWAGIVMGGNGFENAPDLGDALSIAIDETGKSKCRIDYSRYEDFFDDLDVSDTQKHQMIEMLFIIGHAFYDAGFAYEFVGSPCGKLEDNDDDSAAAHQDVVGSSSITLRETFNLCAAE